MSRAETAPELVKLASDGQWSQLYAHVVKPAVVFAARVNQASIKRDKLTELTYDNVTTGSYTDIAPGMTVLIGSTSGNDNKGIGWARKGATSTKIFLGETSNLSPSDNFFITVLNDFSVWAKHPTIAPDGSGTWINFDEAYVDQLSEGKPIINMGSNRAVEMTGATVDVTIPLSAVVPIGTAGSCTFNTTCATSVSVTNGGTSTPSIQYNTTGDHLVKTVCTSPGGKTSTSYRWVYVWDKNNPPANCILKNNDSDSDSWSASITMYEPQSQGNVRDRAQVLIFAKDYYSNGTLGSIGALSGCENIIMSGWIAGSPVTYDADKGSVTFEIRQAGWWLAQEQNTIEVALIASSTDANWHHMTSVTVDRMIWHLVQNYSTLLYSTDLVLTGDTRTALSLVAPLDTVWAQITNIADRIKAVVRSNMYGQVFVHVDLPLIPYADRSGIPVICTLTKDDWAAIDIDVMQTQPTAQVVVTGQLADGSTIKSIGGGRVPNAQGQSAPPIDNLVSSSQSQQNILAGSLYARDNTPYKFSFKNLRGNNRLIDVTPLQRVGLTLLAADNLRGIAYDDYIVVRSISRSHDADTGGWVIDLEADAETRALLYCTGDIPGDPKDPNNPDGPRFPDIKFPKYPSFNPGITDPPDGEPDDPDPVDCTDDSPETGPYILVFQQENGSGWIDGGPDASTRTAYNWGKCTVRSNTADNPTYLAIEITNKGLAYEHLHLYGIDGAGNILITATLYSTVNTFEDNYTLTWKFTGATTVVAGFKITCDMGLDPSSPGEPITYTTNQDDSIINGGTVVLSPTVTQDGTDVIRAILSVNVENTYADPLANLARLRINFSTAITSVQLYYQFYATPSESSSWSKLGGRVGIGTASKQGSYFIAGDFGLSDGTFLTDYRLIDFWNNSIGTFTGIYTLIISSSPNLERSAALGYGVLVNICPAVTS